MLRENPWSCHFWERITIIQRQSFHLYNRKSTAQSILRDINMICCLASALRWWVLFTPVLKLPGPLFFPQVSKCHSWSLTAGGPPHPDNSWMQLPPVSVSSTPTEGKEATTKQPHMIQKGFVDPAVLLSLPAPKRQCAQLSIFWVKSCIFPPFCFNHLINLSWNNNKQQHPSHAPMFHFHGRKHGMFCSGSLLPPSCAPSELKSMDVARPQGICAYRTVLNTDRTLIVAAYFVSF